MNNIIIKPFNVIDHTDFPVMAVDHIPESGDPIEIDNEMYFTCETGSDASGDFRKIGVIPLVVKNPASIPDIEGYLKCLSIAHRRVQFRKKNKICDFNECDEMIIS